MNQISKHKQKEVVKHNFTASVKVSFSVTPTRLAVGLEAKKSSSETQIRPCFAIMQNFGSPVSFPLGKDFGIYLKASLM